MTFLPQDFRIVSWNMQGLSYGKKYEKEKLSLIVKYMLDEQVIGICLQECSNLYHWGDWEKLVKDIGEIYSQEKMGKLNAKRDQDIKARDKVKYSDEYSNDWEDPVIPFQTKGRLTSAILVRKPYASLNNYYKDFTKVATVALVDSDESKAVLGARLNGFSPQKPLYLFCCHVPYKKIEAKEEASYIKKILEGCSSYTKSEDRSNWICVGDFNHKLPHDPQDNPFKDVAYIRRPNKLTTKANEYDYSFVNGEDLIHLSCTIHVDQVELSDHYPIHYLFTPFGLAPNYCSDLASKLVAPTNGYSFYWKEEFRSRMY